MIYRCFKIVFIIENSADPDEIPPYAAFCLGLYCLAKYLFNSIQNEMGKSIITCYGSIIYFNTTPIKSGL